MSRESFKRSLWGYPRTVSKTPLPAMVRMVSGIHGVSAELIHSKQRDDPTAHARQEIYHRAAIEGYSQSETARFFNAHPTTVRHGIKAHRLRTASPRA